MSVPDPSPEWAVYEANVQAYRSIFLSWQSILLAIGAIVLEKSLLFTIIIASFALIQIWYIWFRVIYVRILIVDFHKFCIDKKFDIHGNLLPSVLEPINEEEYATKRKIRNLINKKMGDDFHNIRLTRFKVDILILVMLTVVWCIFIIYDIWK